MSSPGLQISLNKLSKCELRFEQGLVHKDYLDHLFGLFKSLTEPKVKTRLPNKNNGKIYSSVYFNTCSLPCLLELYNLFYPEGKKVVPETIGDLLTPIGLAYWIADDGSFNKTNHAVVLHTQGFSLKEVELLIKVLKNKFNLKCAINKSGANFIIRISSKSLPILQDLLKNIMPSMMKHKIGL